MCGGVVVMVEAKVTPDSSKIYNYAKFSSTVS